MSPRVVRVLASHAASSLAMSLPWPLLLVLVWESTGSDLWLGVTAAARMAPYVALSWWVARLADRMRRDLLVRATLIVRVILLAGVAAALLSDAVTPAVVLSTLAVAVATPAYPALAAGMPRLAGAESNRATELLVTIEVASFVVGPALGGVLLTAPGLVGPLAVTVAAAGWLLYGGIRQPRPASAPLAQAFPHPRAERPALRRRAGGLAARRRTAGALSLLAAVNLVVAITGICLLPLAEQVWRAHPWDWTDASAYGLATGALGFGALGGPLLSRGAASPGPRLARGLLLAGGALLAAALAPALLWACAPLLVVGAAAVSVEATATELLQRTVPDERRAGILGVGDSAMVLAALLGALAAPALAAWAGPRLLLVVMAAVSVAGSLSIRRLVAPTPQPTGVPAAVGVNTLSG